MAEPHGPRAAGTHCFLPTPPLQKTKELAARFECDLAIPNDSGIGNVVIYTRLVDDLSRTLGRPLSLLTAPLQPVVPLISGEDGFAVWRNNPHVDRIVDAEELDPGIMPAINAERDNVIQFGHVIENIAYHYGIRPRTLRPSLYLSRDECIWAQDVLRPLTRPIICLHPYNTSGALPGSPWYLDNWRRLAGRLKSVGSLFEVRQHSFEDKGLGVHSFPTTLRQMFSLVWASDAVVCLDSLISHVATAFERPTIVLWDPTRKVDIEEKWQKGFALATLSRWSYPQNDNMMLLSNNDDDLIDAIVQRVRRRIWAFEA